MEMEFAAEVTTARDRAGQIIRGKRTKRQRPCSPFGVAAATSSSSSGGGGGGGNGSGDGGCVMNYYTTDQQSTAMSSDMSTEEDEDMANCLIMLAQSVSPIKEEKSTDHHRQKTEKLSSRRFTEIAAAAASGKAGFYVYECKTCNRSFPSFQALGGHRASHKKPKLAVEEKKSASINIPIPPPLTEYSDEKPKVIIEDEENKIIINNNDKSSTPPPGFIQTVHNSKSKVHECSICGSEFLSGQALGGHMRRHRTTPPSTSSNQIGISMNIDDRSREVIEKSSRSTSMLSLDLNLPAPEVVDDVHSTYQFPASSSQQHLVFSAPALVDCHY